MTLRLVTWNVDGLDDTEPEVRALGVLRALLATDADVLLLQEVTAPLLQSALLPVLRHAGYAHAFPRPGSVEQSYHCMVFSRRPIVGAERTLFDSSFMGRALVSVDLGDWLVLTSHLESTRSGSRARRQQIQTVMAALDAAGKPAVFGGDTNLRAAEVPALADARDAWRLSGAPPDKRYTWDLVRNHNKVMPGGRKPRARYDRVFVASAQVTAFDLIGEAPLDGGGLWPSDHFGIQVDLDPQDRPGTVSAPSA